MKNRNNNKTKLFSSLSRVKVSASLCLSGNAYSSFCTKFNAEKKMRKTKNRNQVIACLHQRIYCLAVSLKTRESSIPFPNAIRTRTPSHVFQKRFQSTQGKPEPRQRPYNHSSRLHSRGRKIRWYSTSPPNSERSTSRHNNRSALIEFLPYDQEMSTVLPLVCFHEL